MSDCAFGESRAPMEERRLSPNSSSLEEVREKARQWLLRPDLCDELELRAAIRTALRVTDVAKRFKAFFCYELLDRMLREGHDDLELFRVGLGNILKYAVNIMRFPERKEYQRIKTYTGFFKCNVEGTLHYPKSVFMAMGFTDDAQNGVLTIQPADIPRVDEVAVDLLFSQEEIMVMRLVQSNSTVSKPSASDILMARRDVYLDSDDFAMTILEAENYCRSRTKQVGSNREPVCERSSNHLEATATGQDIPLKPSYLPLQQPQDDMLLSDRKNSLTSPLMRSQSVGGTPMKVMTTAEYDDMLKNLPAVAITMPKRTHSVQSHFGESYDDSDPVVSSLSSSFIARHAITVPQHDVYGSSQNIMYHPSDAHESETAAHQLDEEHSIEVSGMYGSGGEDDDVADLKSLIGRAKMHESDLSMVESSRFHDDQQEDDTYQCPQSRALGNYESHIDYRPDQQMNEADIRHHFRQPLAGDNKDASTARHTRQGHGNQTNVCRAQEQVSASDYRSDPWLDPNRLSELHQRQHNSALVTENELNATSVVEQALEQLTPNLPSQHQPSDQLEEHLFNSPESALHGTERLSYRKEGKANSQQLGSVELHTAKGGGDDASGEYAVYSLDNKTGAITETPSFINKGISTNGGENESPRIDNGRYDHIDAMTLKTKRGQLDVHGNDDTKPVGPDIQNIKYKPRDHIPSVAERDSGAATSFTASGRSRSYAAVAATSHEMAPQQVESKGRPSPGTAQPVDLFWKCVHCTYVNCAGASVCSMCSKTRNFQVKASLDSNEKECRSCTLMNPAEAKVCKACGQPFNLLDLPKLKETATGPYLDSTV